MQLRSDAVRCGIPRAPHRSLLKADGLTDEELKRPLVAVFNSRNDIIPGHNNLDKICEAVKAGIYLAGGGALIKGLDKRLNAKTGIPFHVAEDPLRAIARGTGIALKNINRFSFLMK